MKIISELTKTIFYKIVKGEMPCYKIYEDDDFLVFLDIFPAAPGHCLIVPKAPARGIFDVEDKTAAGLYLLARRVAKAVKEATGCDGINILQNNEAAAGQTVFYLHMHVIPRFDADDIALNKTQNPGQTDEEFEEMAKKIRSTLF